MHVTVDRIHAFGPYDVEIDTTAGVSPALVESVLTAWRERSAAAGALVGG